MDFFEIVYYSFLYSFPILLYFIFVKNKATGKYSKPVWYHPFKKWIAKKSVKKFQEKCKLAIDHISPDDKEVPKKIRTKKESDTHVIYGCDKQGNFAIFKIILRQNNHAEVSIQLKLKNGDLYQLPNEPEVLLCSTVSRKWKGQNLEIAVLEPFKSLRVTYNGFLKKTKIDSRTSSVVEHVKFNFIWIAANRPFFYPHDSSTNLLANTLALEKWKDSHWIEMIDVEKGYEQFGELKGVVSGSNFEKDLVLLLPSWRRRYYGIANAYALHRDFNIFGIATDGTIFNLGVKSYQYGCTQLKYGSVYKNNKTVSVLEDNDIHLEYTAESENLPEMLTTHFTADGKTYKCICHIKKDHSVSIYNNETKGWKETITEAKCDLTTQEANALVTCWYNNNGAGKDFPTPLLKDSKRIDKEEMLVLPLCDSSSKILSLTGGKGNSLALLKTLKDVEFAVPDGFIVTTDAFKRQLEKNDELKDQLEKLEKSCNDKETLRKLCSETMDMFADMNLEEGIKTDVLRHIEFIKTNALKLNEVDVKWAVRSSAIGEDSEDLSAAGQNATFLGCSNEEMVLGAIKRCWGSLFSFQSTQYRRQHGMSIKSEIAVVVQKMVPSDVAGVLFSCHPTTGNPAEMVITANYGLGESVVSGQVEPDTIVLNRTWDGKISVKSMTVGSKSLKIDMSNKMNSVEGTENIDVQKSLQDTLCISEAQAEKLGKVGVFLEQSFGSPRDIEWAYYKDQLYLLQSRPITTLKTWTSFELEHELDTPITSEESLVTTANLGEVMPGAMTVLSQTVITKRLEAAIQDLAFGKRRNTCALHVFVSANHSMFLDLINSMYISVEKEITVYTRVLDLAVVGYAVIDEKIHSLAVARNGVLTPYRQVKEFLDLLILACTANGIFKKATKIGNTFKIDINGNDEPLEILAKIEAMLPILETACQYHCIASRVSILWQFIALIILAGNSKEFTSEHYQDISLLLSSSGEVVSAEVPVILGKIAQIIFEEGLSEEFVNLDPEECMIWLRHKLPEAHKDMEHFLARHGHRSFKEFELMEKTWSMDTRNIFKMLQANAKTKTFTQKSRALSVDETISRLVAPQNIINRYALKFFVKMCRKAVQRRENTKSEIVKVVSKFKGAFRVLGQQMYERGYLPHSDLVYHLTHHEIKQVLQKPSPTLIFKAIRREKLFPEWNKREYRDTIYGHPEPEMTYIQELQNNGSSIDMKMKGTPVYPGNVTARCSVILDLTNMEDLRTGDILITHSTDIGWSPYFPMLAGIVTELGGLISHGAVVAREYGLPSIVGVINATKYFKTGDIILLDGQKGTLELISRQ